MLVIGWLAMMAAAAPGPNCVSASIDARGGLIRASGVELSVPAGLWAGAQTVTVCPTTSRGWDVHLPVRRGTDPKVLAGALSFHMEATAASTNSSTDILFTLDRSCSMNETATLSITQLTSSGIPAVDWVPATGKPESLRIVVIRRTRKYLIVRADSAAP